MSPADLDVTGEWSGVYSYAGSFAVVSFEARLDEALGVVAGTTEEALRRAPKRRVTASVQGEREASHVSFVKRYDAPVTPGYETPVVYVGSLNSDGNEIHGEWTLPGARGPFLMIRARSLEDDRAQTAENALGVKRS